MQVVRAAGQRLALEPLLALVGDAVAIGIGQLPDARRRRDVERSIEPHRPFRQHHLVGEDDALVETAVAVRVFQPDDSVRLVGQLLLDVVVRAGGVGDIQPALSSKSATIGRSTSGGPATRSTSKPGGAVRVNADCDGASWAPGSTRDIKMTATDAPARGAASIVDFIGFIDSMRA